MIGVSFVRRSALAMRHSCCRLWVLGLLFGAWAWSAQPLWADLFTEIVAFGDSLTDTGNYFTRANNTAPDPGTYYQGRWSNGPVWVERLAADLGVPAPTASLLGG